MVHINGVGIYTSTFTVPFAADQQRECQLRRVLCDDHSCPEPTLDQAQGTSSVTFNGVAATATAWSNTSISTSVPYSATTGNLVVTVAGQPSNGVPFTVEPSFHHRDQPNQRTCRNHGHD